MWSVTSEARNESEAVFTDDPQAGQKALISGISAAQFEQIMIGLEMILEILEPSLVGGRLAIVTMRLLRPRVMPFPENGSTKGQRPTTNDQSPTTHSPFVIPPLPP